RFAIEVFLPNGGVNRSHAHHSQEPRSCGGANPPGKAGENSAAHFVRRIHGKMVGPCRAPVERGRKRRVSRRRISVFVQAITYSFSHFLFSPHPALSRKQPAQETVAALCERRAVLCERRTRCTFWPDFGGHRPPLQSPEIVLRYGITL